MPPRKTKSRVAARSSIVAAVRLGLAVKVAAVVGFCAVGAAAAAGITMQLNPAKLTISLVSPTKNPIVAKSGDTDVASFALNFRAGKNDVFLNSITLGVFADNDGEFVKNVANDVDPKKLLGACRLQEGTRVVSDTVPGSASMRFSSMYGGFGAPAQTTRSLKVVCDLTNKTTNNDPDMYAFALLSPADISAGPAVKGAVLYMPSEISFGPGVSNLNANGATASVRVNTATTASVVPTAPVPQGNLLKVFAAPTVASASIVPGMQGVPVLGIVFQPNATTSLHQLTERVTLSNSAIFAQGTAQAVADIQARITSCRLYDGASNTPVSYPRYVETNGELFFNPIQWTVPGGTTGTLITKCNFAAISPTTDANTYTFSVADKSKFDAWDPNGNSIAINGADNLNGDGTTSGRPTTIITVLASGAVSANNDPATPPAADLSSNQFRVPVATFRLLAQNENVRVTDITLSNCLGMLINLNMNCKESGETPGVDDVTTAVHIAYTDAGGAQVQRTGFLSGGSVHFSGLDMYLPARQSGGGPQTLSVYINTNDLAYGTVPPGSKIQLNLVSTGFRAVGAASGSLIDIFSPNLAAVGKPMTLAH